MLVRAMVRATIARTAFEVLFEIATSRRMLFLPFRVTQEEIARKCPNLKLLKTSHFMNDHSGPFVSGQRHCGKVDTAKGRFARTLECVHLMESRIRGKVFNSPNMGAAWLLEG